jgi:hypothetical protein
MTSAAKKREEKAWNELVDSVRALYPEPLPQSEAEEAARNLLEFFKILMEAERELRNKQKQSKSKEDSPC